MDINKDKNDNDDQATVIKPSNTVDNQKTRLQPRPDNLPGNSPAPLTTDTPQQLEKAQNNINQATVIKPSATADNQKTRLQPQAEKTPEPLPAEIALTRINNNFKSQDTSQGFEKARNDADQALADNKIILNNRFVLEETLGSGGMGTVYKAQDLRKVEANDLNPYVAVKVLNSDFQNHPDAFVSLQREASRSHTLSHPNIITVHDFDRDGNTIFMTMELLDGQGMDIMLRNYRNIGLETDQAMSIINDYCSALEYAHKKNIIHSDLKPGNIFICEDSAKVLDFGIARITSESKQQDNFDAGSLGALTPAYASLEMILAEPPAASDDVYAAAIIAYELFTGKHPYDRKPADEALANGLKPERITKLSSRQWKALEKALELKRSKRTPTIQQFHEELTGTRLLPVFKFASLILLGVVGWFIYAEYFMPNDLTVVIDSTLEKADDCYSDSDFLCAIESANTVLKIAPDNKLAQNLLKDAEQAYSAQQVVLIIHSVTNCLVKNNIDCARENLNSLAKLKPEHKQINSLGKQIDAEIDKQFIQASLVKADNCFANQQFDCVLDNTNKILQRDPQQNTALELAQNANRQIKLINDKAQENEKQYQKNMNIASSCFIKNNYACSVKHAKLALQIKPGETAAESLKQKSNYALQQAADDLDKANREVARAKTCLEQKNYSCAISKSESALEFSPNHSQALQLLKKAKNELAALKNRIEIN